eukprot:TRINITY_DN6417_c0_g1_i1.p1 TRINITY_DN6417_c0_g1~~TRINITY_DN6417_c0_g1_i1.p1  ORF type:complete len:483 (+),score=87.40 TRINITY_DN6417_c0_g1_i1:176-1624(+)
MGACLRSESSEHRTGDAIPESAAARPEEAIADRNHESHQQWSWPWLLSREGHQLWESRSHIREHAKRGIFKQGRGPCVVTTAEAAMRVLDPTALDQHVTRDAIGKDRPRTAGNEYMAASLTACNEAEWERQRRVLVGGVLPSVLGHRPIQIALRISAELKTSLLKVARAGTLVGVKELLMPRVAQWICELVLGPGHAREAWEPFVQTWQAKRRQADPNPESHAAFQAYLEGAVTLIQDPESLVGAMRASGELSDQVVVANSWSFLMAGFETTFHVISTTLLMIAARPELAEEVEKACQGDALDSESISALKCMKQLATTGRPLSDIPKDLADGHPLILARCILETLHKLPPVWTLPRAGPPDIVCPHLKNVVADTVQVKVDVAACNGAASPAQAWDPTSPIREGTHLLSFGLGGRSCPGGGSALAASFVLLRRLFGDFRVVLEDAGEVAAVLEGAYLAPTLCFKRSPLLKICAIDGLADDSK